MTFANDGSLEALVTAMQSGSLAWPVSQLGLSAPVVPFAPAIDGTMAEFVTLEEMVGKSASIDEIVHTLNRFTQDAVLIACAQVLHGLFRHPQGMKVAEQDLVGMLPPGWEARFRSLPTAMPGTDRVVATPQAMLNLAKLALTRHEPGPDQLPAMPLQIVLPVGMAVASHLERDLLGEEPYWGAAADLFVYMFVNHYLYAYDDDGAQIARARALEHLRREADDSQAAAYDEVFRKSTGASPAAARVMASSFWAGTQTGPLLSDNFGSNALFTEEERIAAIATVASDAATLKSLIGAEHGRLGAGPTDLVSWAFNSFRQSPVIRLSDGRLLVLHPGFLVDHVFDFDYDRRVVYSFSSRQEQDKFRSFRAHAHELLVGMSLAATFPKALSKRVWVDAELGAMWGGRHCDFLIDGGDAILMIEVTSHPVTEKAVAGVSLDAVDRDIETMVICKADQLNATVNSFLQHEDELLGVGSSSLGRPIIPMVVATSGFPWNFQTSQVIWRQLKGVQLRWSDATMSSGGAGDDVSGVLGPVHPRPFLAAVEREVLVPVPVLADRA